MNDKQRLGRKGEELAVRYLEQEGMDVLERNWRYSRYEIDIIAEDENVVVFIEVKSRRSELIAPAESTVNAAKQRHIVDAANRFMESIDYDGEIRFDIVTILWHGETGYTITHMRDAFFPGME